MMAQIQQEDRINLGAKKFGMWIFIFTSFMIFAAFSSGFIVYSGGKGHGLDVILPRAFMYSTAVIILSSVTLFFASRAAKRLEFKKQRMFLWLTFVLGIAFFCSTDLCMVCVNGTNGHLFHQPKCIAFFYIYI